jgi:hypothetical protein
MPKYHILYTAPRSRNFVWDTEIERYTELEARRYFEEFFPHAELLRIRKGEKWKAAEKAAISKRLKFA